MTSLYRLRIRALDRAQHLFRVTASFTPAQAGPVHLRFPTWLPGSYMIREYARHVVQVHAKAGDQDLAIHKTDKATWTLDAPPAGQTIKVEFDIYAYDFSVRGATLTDRRMYFNGAAVFAQWVGYEGPIELDIENDSVGVAQGVCVATTMPPLLVDELGFGRYRATDYDALLDFPVEVSAHERLTFDVRGISHTLVVTGAYKADLARVANDTQNICAQHLAMFHGQSDTPAFSQYLFLLNVLPEGYGGLEHRDSTSLICALADLPIHNEPTISEGYLGLLGLISHEYFHAWNVKSMKPAAFVPYDLAQEALTTQLWIYEGFTSYYDDLALVRSGVITHEDYLRLIGRNLTALQRTPGRHVQPVAQASYDAWIKYYRSDENTPNAQASYYLKGGLVALLLDLTLRAKGEHTLDDVMRIFFKRFRDAGRSYRGTQEREIDEILKMLTVEDWGDWINAMVFGVAPLPIESALKAFGVSAHWRPAHSPGDRGGLPGSATAQGTHLLALGITLAEGDRVKTVLSGSAASRAGVCVNDTLVALDSLRISHGGLAHALVRAKAGDSLALHVFREARLIALTITVPVAQLDTAWLNFEAAASPQARARCQAWLAGQ